MQIYSDPTRENDIHALPDVEVFYARPTVIECGDCGNSVLPWDGTYDHDYFKCPQCGKLTKRARFDRNDAGQYWYWYCLPGCLPDSDPIGPFATEEEAIAAAQEDN